MEKKAPFDIEVLRKKLASGEPHQLTVVSDSMTPLIKVGEEITIKAKPAPENLQIFDIVLFYQGGRLNAHILTKIDKNKDQLITRPLKDPRHQDYPLNYDDLLGVISNKQLSWWHKFKVLAGSI